jgi:hypothetical protein
MSPADDYETPLFIELVGERGFNPFALSTEIAEEIASAAEAIQEIIHENTHYIPRDVAQ